MTKQVTQPNLDDRPFNLSVEREVGASPQTLTYAFTTGMDRWFGAPGTLLTTPEVNGCFFFATEHADQRHPHYGRFLRLEPGQVIEFTWVTGAGGTEGAETVVTVELRPTDTGTNLRLTHAGFPHEAARDGHAAAWPMVLDQLERTLPDLQQP